MYYVVSVDELYYNNEKIISYSYHLPNYNILNYNNR